jgi:hypothetical protein
MNVVYATPILVVARIKYLSRDAQLKQPAAGLCFALASALLQRPRPLIRPASKHGLRLIMAVPRANYDPRRVCLNPFPEWTLGKHKRTAGIYLAGALVRRPRSTSLNPTSNTRGTLSLPSRTGPSSTPPSSPLTRARSHGKTHATTSRSTSPSLTGCRASSPSSGSSSSTSLTRTVFVATPASGTRARFGARASSYSSASP